MKTEKQTVQPAFKENNVAVVLASSAYYAPYMAVAIQSIIENATKSYNYDFLLIHKEISEIDQKAVCGLAERYENISIRFVPVTEEVAQNNFNFRSDVATASESFYCVLLQELLPNHDKVICIDCDLVVLDDIAKLYAIELEENLIAAVRDPDGIGNVYAVAAGKNKVPKMAGRDVYMLETLGLNKIEDYFQSGVMVLNLAEWRKTYSVQQILDVACADWILWGDQDTMNVLCRNRVTYLPMEWNTVINQKGKQIDPLMKFGPKEILQEYLDARKHPKIIHYAGTKPWNEKLVDFFPYFWKYAVNTPFYNEIYRRAEQMQIEEKRKQEPTEEIVEKYRTGQLGFRYILRCMKAWFYYKARR